MRDGKLGLRAALLSGLALMAASARAVPVAVPTGPYIPDTAGPTMVPIEVDAAPITADQGELKKAAVIATHTFRPLATVVVDGAGEVKDTVARLHAGDRLSRTITIFKGQPATLWCDMRYHRGIGYDCLEDNNGDGHFTMRWRAVSRDAFVGVLPSLVWPDHAIAEPISYHPAAGSERETWRFGYEVCKMPKGDDPPRFDLVFDAGKGWERPDYEPCLTGVWASPDHTEVLVGALRVRLTTQPGGGVAYTVENRIAPGAYDRIGRFGAPSR